MYRPTQFREDRTDVLVGAIKELKFGSIVTLAGTEFIATHIPMLIKEDGEVIRLEGHVARANPQWNQFDSAVPALAIFVGPQAYISLTWYATKTEHQRVVPTWNYISVQASGPLSVFEDKEWLLRHIGELTDHNEATQAKPWRVDHAPAEFIE